MGKKGPRQLVFVCSAIHNGKLISDVIDREVSEESCKLFEERHGIKPHTVYGPFYRKRMGVLDSHANIKFAGVKKTGTYMDWNVTLLYLDDPAGCAWVFFETRVDGSTDKKILKPKSTIVKIEDVVVT